MNDFRVRSTGTSLDLFPDTVVPLEINNPLFNTDALAGTFTYPFDIPLTDKNRLELGFPESLLNRIVSSPSVDIDYYYEGVLFKLGVLKIIKITDKISVSFVAGVGGLNDKIKGKKMAQVNYGGVISLPVNNTLGLNFVNYVPPHFIDPKTSFYMHLTLNITYGGVTNEFFKIAPSKVNRHDDIIALAAAFNADTAGLAANHIISVATDINESVAPFYYKIIFEFNTGVTAAVNMDSVSPSYYKSSFWSRVPTAFMDTKQDFVKAIAQLSYPDTNYTFFPLKNEGFYSSNNADYCGYINFYNISTGKFSINTTTDGLRTKFSICPFPFFIHVLKSCLSDNSYIANGSFIDNEEIQKVVIYNNTALDSILFDSVTPTTVVINKWADTFDLKNCVPDLLISDFLKFVKSFFCIGYFVDDTKKTVEIILLKDVLESPEYDDFTSITSKLKEIDLNDGLGYKLKLPDTSDQYIKDNVKDLSLYKVKDPVVTTSDLTALTDQQEGDVRYVSSLDEYWQFKLRTNGTTITNHWEKLSEDYYDYIVGNGGNEIPLNANTLLMVHDPTSPFLLLPITNESGSSKEFDLGNNNKDKLRFLIYRGLCEGPFGNLYPFGTNGYKRYDGTTIGSLSLKLDDPTYGLNKQFFSAWLQFLSKTKPVIGTSELDLAKLMDINLLKKKKRIDQVNYLTNKVNVNMGMHRISPATVQYYKV